MAHPFITLYGINNLGKSTQAERLVKRIIDSGMPAVHIKYPRYDIEPSGPYINSILRGGIQPGSQKEVELWMAINRHQAEPELKQLLEKQVVVSEDYVGTGIAWGIANGSAQEWMEQINAGLLTEDFAILLDGERFTQAVEKGHVHETNTELTDRCRRIHQDLARQHGWPTVNANGTIDEVHEAIWQLVNAKFNFA